MDGGLLLPGDARGRRTAWRTAFDRCAIHDACLHLIYPKAAFRIAQILECDASDSDCRVAVIRPTQGENTVRRNGAPIWIWVCRPFMRVEQCVIVAAARQG